MPTQSKPEQPRNISTYGHFLDDPKAPIPGTICHIGCPPGGVRNDLRFVIADEGGVWFQFPERGWDNDKEQIAWGDLIEFWAWPTVWLLELSPHEASTHTYWRSFQHRWTAAAALIALAKKDYPDDIKEIDRAYSKFEERRNPVLSWRRFMMFPVRLEE